MAQVILIEDNKTLNELISINLNTYLGVDIIQRKNAIDAIGLISILPNIDLIITNFSIDNEYTADALADYVKQNHLEIGIIVLGGDFHLERHPKDHIIHLKNEKDWEGVVQNAAKILGINEDVFVKKVIPDYVPVPVKYFLNLENVNCDVFIRIKKSPTEYQYIKRIHNGDTFSKESIKRYLDQGLENFHIPKENHKNFTIFLSNKLVEKIDRPEIELTQRIQIMGESYEVVMKEITKLGFTSETIQLTDTIIQNMVKNFEKSPEMSNLLHKVINSKTGLLYQRCHMTSVVASEIVKNLKITDQNVFEKLAYAAFFHDIMLTDNIDLSKINSFEQLESSQLSEENWDRVFNHAFEASVLIRKHPEAPQGVDEIIKHHHGASNGKGFSNNIDKLPDLSKIFIIAHHFVLELVHFKEHGGEVRPITDELYLRFPSAEITVIIKALEKTLRKKK
jgi:HD-GYP domain-containing protein (c-di-GMP phosphodiesterase class II)